MTDSKKTNLVGDREYPTCLKHMEELSLLCLETKCKSRLICGICEENDHHQHKVTSLRAFLSGLGFSEDAENVGTLFKASEQIKAALHSTLEEVNQIRQNCLKELSRVQVSLQSYCNMLSDRLLQLQRYNSRQHIVRLLDANFETERVAQLNDVVNQLISRSQISVEQAAARYVSSTLSKFNYVKNSLSKLSFKDTTNLISKHLNSVVKPVRGLGYSWSEHKAQKITINEMTATQTGVGSNAERFALLDPIIEGEFINVDFRIKKVQGWVGVGICLKKEITKAGLKFNYTKTFHGSYLVSANGYSWSHSEPGFNSSYKGFTFSAGDQISVLYDPDQKQVHYENKTKNTKFMLNVLPAPPDDIYVPCVNLCNSGDQVELVNT